MPDRNAPPLCGQPWSTIYVQWDGKLTRPCIRGPRNLGSIENADVTAFWNGPSFADVRDRVAREENLDAPCAACFKDRGRLIDHLTPFLDNIQGFDEDKIDNYYHALGEYEGGKTVIGSKPVVLVLDLSSRCQIRCPKCFVYNSNMQYGLGHMTMATFDTLVPLLRTALLVVGHENGESMLNRNFMEMARIIKENGCRFTFNTTGQLLAPEKSQVLVDLGVDEIMFSIDSIDEARYAVMHKGGTLAKLMGNLEALNRAKAAANTNRPSIGWYFVASKSNIGEIPAIIDRAADLGFGSMFMSHLNKPTREQWRSYFDYFRAESFSRSEDDKAVFRDAMAAAREMAAKRNIRFYAGAFD